MVERKGRRPADNNVQDVLSTIDNYQSGPVRALAQDPPQNASDARRNRRDEGKVEYVRHNRKDADGSDFTLLTITDSGTTGLDGPMLTLADLERREEEEGELVIRQGENWAAWEAMRYTKAGEDKLGSRGQGKYAYLYHSAHPRPDSEDDPDTQPKNNWRMIILYDTLLESGDYRLGVRYHNPATQVVEPPFENEDAFNVLRNGYSDNGFEIPLGLEPLREIGTRVIIPFLSHEAREAIDSKELHRWLCLEWWRQIQKGLLSITVDCGDGLVEEIGIPAYWTDTPWTSDSDRYFVREKVTDPVACGMIKRFVVCHDEGLDDEGYADYEGNPQEVGIQMLRGGQWITTLGTIEFSDVIPPEFRKGIRGFVEFDESVEAELREIENPAHDGFNKRMGLYQEILQTIKQLMETFAIERGWLEDEEDEQESSYEEMLKELVEFFVEPEEEDVHADWSSRVSISCEGPGNQASWGESVGVTAECRRTPADNGPTVEFTAVLVRPDGSEVDIFDSRSQSLSSRRGAEYSSAGCDFGQLDVMNPGRDPLRRFQGPGRYAIAVRCVVDGEEVTRSRSVFYVEAEPPPPPPRTVTMEIQVRNGDVRSERFEDGDELSVVATVRNYSPDGQDGDLNIAVVDLQDGVLLRKSVSIAGVSPGMPPEQVTEVTDKRTVHEADSGDPKALVLSRGRHVIRASFEHYGEVLAEASAIVIVDDDDDDDDDDGKGPPFDLIPRANSDAPRWSYIQRHGVGEKDLVEWSVGNPVYTTLMKTKSSSASNEYVRAVTLEALIEWAVLAYESGGDEGRLRIVTESVQRAVPSLVNKMEDAIERLKATLGDSPGTRDIHFGNCQRKLAAVMALAIRESRD